MVIYMLRFPSPLTAAATELVIACLEIAADMAVDFDPPEAWRIVYPLSAECFTSELARATLLDLVGKLRLPEAYVPTEYHWLLLYECLKVQIEVLNDVPFPAFVAQLTTLATAHDALYLSLPTRAQGVEGFYIDCDALIDTYFWDTDFLLDAESFTRLNAEAKTMLGFSPSVFGVTQGLAPHPEELVLRRAEE
jgi:hypothetical protein